MVQFIYFDIGGVLMDWSEVFSSAAKKFDLDSEDIGKIFDNNHDPMTLGQMSADQLWKKCIQKYQLKNAYNYDFLNSWVSDYKPIKQMHALVSKLSSKYKIGLISNIYKNMLPLLLKKKIIPNIAYDQIVFSCDVGMMKPNEDIFDLAQKKSKTSPENILLVDDRKDYCKAAEKLGWKTFIFDTNNLGSAILEINNLLEKN